MVASYLYYYYTTKKGYSIFLRKVVAIHSTYRVEPAVYSLEGASFTELICTTKGTFGNAM